MENRSRLARTFAALFLAASTLAFVPAVHAEWCDQRGWGDRDDYCEVREMTMPAGRAVIAVDARPNGGIQAEGWDGNEIRVEARVSTHADSGERAREMASEIQIETDGTIHARGPRRGRDEHWSVSYRLRVPRASNLSFESTNGGITVVEVEGDIDLETTNGGLKVHGAAGDVRGRTTNGGVSVILIGDTWEGDGLDLRTTNGGVTIEVPEGYSARFEASTTHGGVRTDFPVMLEQQPGRNVALDLGSGGPPIRVRTTNGGVRLRHP